MKRVKYEADVEPEALAVFREGVLDWYRTHGRDLPWRKTRDPYHILVSEIMLHQTTVTTVEPVYREFLARFPTIQALAQASLADVKAITDPLGYKVRGRWLWEIAQEVVRRYDGVVPDRLDDLLALPGIGRYTAGAILSFAYGQDAPILDTNVKRLLGRYFRLEYRTTRAEILHQLWALAEAVIPPGQAADFNQGLMDMGAMVCTARRPSCTICPLWAYCGVHHDEADRAAEEPWQYRVRPRA
ncbi:A/G-specific adenine glycosylase [Sulfobacillus acidophilus TPY]|uniref:Adenine DNA glycosylase n=1 Tax=Sulfobacillus acidophilus (strain ATCC 700253 / DSM 10332 / NAL) TaxID=679936 RepID=G8TYA0_SULAD|nr:A/G-specific adenine glycosylase [Sulfobacillus acidophilus TPY]AEW05064.1 A/G-specific DNA-adenine glycosylase [Sulfobacillus acidophilus DSM 10332]